MAYLWIEPHLKESFVEVLEERVGLHAEVDDFFFSPTGRVEGVGLVFEGKHPVLGQLTFKAEEYSIVPLDNIYEYLWDNQEKFNWLDLSYDVNMRHITVTGEHEFLQIINLDDLQVELSPKSTLISLEALSWEGKGSYADLENLRFHLQDDKAIVQVERLAAIGKDKDAELGGMTFELLFPKDLGSIFSEKVALKDYLSFIEDWRASSIKYQDPQHKAQIEALRMLKLSDTTWNLNAALSYNDYKAKMDNRIEFIEDKSWALKGQYKLEEYDRIFDYSIEGPFQMQGPWTLLLNDRKSNKVEIDLTKSAEDDWIGTVNLDLTSLKIPRIEGPVISGKLKGGLRIDQKQEIIKLSLNGNDLAGGPNMTREGELSLEMNWDRKINMINLNSLQAGEGDKWSASGNGRILVDSLTPEYFFFQVEKFPLGKYSPKVSGDINIKASLNKESLDVRVFSDRLMPNKDPLQSMDKFEMLIFNDPKNVKFKLSSIQRGTPNQIELEAKVKNLLIEPEKIKTGTLKVFRTQSDLFDLQLKEDVPVDINIIGLEVKNFHLDDVNKRLRDLKGRAYIPFIKASTLDMRAEGVLDMANLPQVASTEMKGKITVKDAVWDKGWSLKNIKAKLVGQGLNLKPEDILPSIRVQNVAGRLEDSKIFIDQLRGRTKEGKLAVEGVYDFVENKIHFKAEAESLSFSNDDYDLLYDVEKLDIAGETLDLMIQGNLVVKDFLYNKDVSLNEEEVTLQRVAMKPPEALDVRHRVDFKILTPEPLMINNNIARLKFESQGLRVYGPLVKPKWKGSIVSVEDSKNLVTLPIQFLDVSMKAKKISLNFQGQDEWNPNVKLDAHSDIDDVDVFFKYNGDMDNVYAGEYQLSSIPAYSRQEILALLGTGDRPNQAPFEGTNETQQNSESPSLTLIKSNSVPISPIPITYQASVSSGHTPFEFRVDYRLNKFLGVEISQSADEAAFAGLRFSKNMNEWNELFDFGSSDKEDKIDEKQPVKWQLSGVPGAPFRFMPNPLRNQLRKYVNSSLLEGEYDLARKRIEKIVNTYLMEKGYRDAVYTVKEISQNIKTTSKRNGTVNFRHNEIIVRIHIESGRPYSLQEVEIVGIPANLKLSHPWLKPNGKRLKLLKMKEVELFKQSILRKLSDLGYPAAKVNSLELLPVIGNDVRHLQNVYENFVVVESPKVISRGTIPQKLRIKIDSGKYHQVVQVVVEGLVALEEEEAKSIMGYDSITDYKESNLEMYRSRLQSWYEEEGYFDTQVILDQALISRSYPRVSLHYKVSEGRRWKCGQLYFKGIDNIDSDYLYRKFTLKPGEWMSVKKVQQAFSDFSQSEIVRAVEHQWIDTDEPDVRDLEIRIQEISKLRLAMRLGYESGEGLQYALRVKEYHLGGLGHSLSYESNFSADEQLHLLRYEIPETPKDDWKSQFILAREVKLLSRLELENTSNIFGVSVGTKDKTHRLDHDIFYKEDRNFQGQVPSVRYRFNLSKSHAELPFQPGKGLGYRIKSTLASYLEEDGLYYYGDYRVSYGFKLGGSLMTPWTRLAHSQMLESNFNVPFADRYFLGGAKSLRGFGEEEISGTNGYGGESLWAGGLELFYPIHKWMDGSIFYEMGRLYNGNLEIPLESLSHSIGLGMLIRTPVGPIQGYFAHPFGTDEIGRIGLQLGTIF